MFCFPVSDHVMPSWEFFISYAYICTCIRRHLKETIPSSSITWSEMEKQNIQAKEVYFLSYLVQDYSYIFFNLVLHNAIMSGAADFMHPFELDMFFFHLSIGC